MHRAPFRVELRLIFSTALITGHNRCLLQVQRNRDRFSRCTVQNRDSKNRQKRSGEYWSDIFPTVCKDLSRKRSPPECCECSGGSLLCMSTNVYLSIYACRQSQPIRYMLTHPQGSHGSLFFFRPSGGCCCVLDKGSAAPSLLHFLAARSADAEFKTWSVL